MKKNTVTPHLSGWLSSDNFDQSGPQTTEKQVQEALIWKENKCHEVHAS